MRSPPRPVNGNGVRGRGQLQTCVWTQAHTWLCWGCPGLDRRRRAKADERDHRLACRNCIRERGGGVQSTGELSVIAQHHFRGKVVVDVSYPGYDASHSEL